MGDATDRLRAWLAPRVTGTGTSEVQVEHLDRVDVGHSAEMMTLALVWGHACSVLRRDVVVRLRPPEPGLLEPYDLQRQFDILTALGPTDVPIPDALWMEPTGDVLGRPFLVMERVAGEVYERDVPADLTQQPDRVQRMCHRMIDEAAGIHSVDLEATGLARLGDGCNFLDRELDRWHRDMQGVAQGPLPGLERLYAELRARQPEQSSTVTLVHGDLKPGNVAFVGDAVSAIFDWEMTDIGDPLVDIGYFELLWRMPVGLPSCPSAPSADELVARYEERSGISARHREWYRALAAYKVAVISLRASMLFDAGHSDDLRYMEMGYGVPYVTGLGLHEFGIDEEIEAGPVTARPERIKAARTAEKARS
jgi:aminoglycoside phosphotransferase (APT) family kinase protein